MAFEQVRIMQFTPLEMRQQEIDNLMKNGLPYLEQLAVTPSKVQSDSMHCNAPQHRRAKARDGAVMR